MHVCQYPTGNDCGSSLLGSLRLHAHEKCERNHCASPVRQIQPRPCNLRDRPALLSGHARVYEGIRCCRYAHSRWCDANTTSPFRETPANGINGPKYAEWIIRGPLIEAVRTFTNQGRLPIVMEDNSRVHNNEYCDLTRRDLGYRRLFHPPYSPDLNPIENAWSELQGRLANFPVHARNGDVLWGQADSAWEAIPMSYINTLVDSMPRRLEAVRAAQGGETKY